MKKEFIYKRKCHQLITLPFFDKVLVAIYLFYFISSWEMEKTCVLLTTTT